MARIVPILTLLAGLVIGFVVAVVTRNAPPSTSTIAPPNAVGPSDPTQPSPNANAPDAADLLERIAESQNHPNPVRNLLELGHLMLTLPEAQLPAALKLLADSKYRQSALMATMALFCRWSEFDTGAALEAAARLADPEERAFARQGLLAGWIDLDVDAALQFVAGIENESERLVLEDSAIDMLAVMRPERGAALAVATTDSELRRLRCARIASGWVASDPQAAIQWIATMNRPDQRRELHLIALRSWAIDAPANAARHAVEIPNLAHRNEALRDVLRVWSSREPGKALDFLFALPAEGASQSGILAALTDSLASLDQEKLAEAILRVPEGSQRQSFIGKIAGARAAHQPAEAAALAELLGEGRARADAYRAIASNWANRNPEAGSAWLESLPAGNDRDIAAAVFSRTVFGSDPMAGIRYTSLLTGEDNRQNHLLSLGTLWLGTNRPAALKWIRTAPELSEENRTALLNR